MARKDHAARPGRTDRDAPETAADAPAPETLAEEWQAAWTAGWDARTAADESEGEDPVIPPAASRAAAPRAPAPAEAAHKRGRPESAAAQALGDSDLARAFEEKLAAQTPPGAQSPARTARKADAEAKRQAKSRRLSDRARAAEADSAARRAAQGPDAPPAPTHPLDRFVTAVLGPTNTGKTHMAIERMLGHRTGVMGFPLRLLAREVYDKIVARRGPSVVALVTGEEKIVPAQARYWICTVEAMPLDQGADFLAVDEIQMCADPDRGHVFTDRLLNARGVRETMFLGSSSMRSRIAELIPEARFERRDRFSTLSYAGAKKLSRMPGRSAVVGFSVDNVYAIAELMRRQKGGAAVVMGALSPRTRNAQVELYQNGDVEHLVATDAIGMGLNLDVRHVAFASLGKFDGRRHRELMPHELGQIAGRAGRWKADGTFGVTGEAHGLSPDLVEAIEQHRYAPVAKLCWRNPNLSFGSVDSLIESLEAPPDRPGLVRAREADDLAALRRMAQDEELRAMASGPQSLKLLWEVCRIPDFRKTSPHDHVGLLSRIYRFLQSDGGCIPSGWMAGQIRRVDRMDGDIDALAKRLAFIRTWTYVAARGDWVEEAETWRGETRDVEDRLSDALHARLTQRFVDRRTSVLMRRLKQKEALVADVNEAGEVRVDEHLLGRIDGFRFTPDPEAKGDEARTLKAASTEALASEFSRRADKLYNAPDGEIELTEQGGLMWGEHAVGKLVLGPDPLRPEIKPFVDEIAGEDVATRVQRRLTHWVNRRIEQQFEPMLKMRDDEALTGLARGIAFRLVETLGVIPRPEIAKDVKELDQDGRAQLRKHGVRFGQHTIFMPALLKPAPTRLRLALWSLAEGFEVFPEPMPAGIVTAPARDDVTEGFWPRAGYRLAGTRAIRIDMLERLADLIRNQDARAGFEATPDMLSITGCTLDQFAELMQGLGYKAEKGERPKVKGPAETPSKADRAKAAETGEAETAEDAPADAAAEVSAEAAAETPAEAPVEAAAEAPAETAAEEPAELQAFYTFTWAPRPRREGGGAGAGRGRRGPPRQDGGEDRDRGPRKEGGGRGRGAPKGDRFEGGPKGDRPRGKGGPKGGGPKGKPREQTPRTFSARPDKPGKAMDPDNPFAALAALKDKS